MQIQVVTFERESKPGVDTILGAVRSALKREDSSVQVSIQNRKIPNSKRATVEVRTTLDRTNVIEAFKLAGAVKARPRISAAPERATLTP